MSTTGERCWKCNRVLAAGMCDHCYPETDGEPPRKERKQRKPRRRKQRWHKTWKGSP